MIPDRRSFLCHVLLVLLLVPGILVFVSGCADKSQPSGALPAPTPNPGQDALLSPFVNPGETPATGQTVQPPTAKESIEPSCSYFYFLWGTHAESNKKYQEAQEAYEKALICDPDADYVLKKLPVLLIKMEKQHAAAQWLREAIKKNPNDIDNQLLLARLDINAGDMAEATQIYEKILELAPDNSSVRLRLGYLYSQQGRYKDGENTIKVLLTKDPDSYYAQLYLARLAVQSGEYDTAAAYYDRILVANWSPDLALEAAEFFSLREQYKRVEQIYAAILKEDPENEQAALGRVHALLQLDQGKKALEELARIRTFSKKPTNIDLITSRIHIRARNFSKANALLEKIVAKENSSPAHYMLAIVRYENKKLEAALAHLRKITHDDEEFENSIALQVKILSELKRTPEALTLLRRLIDNPKLRQPLYYSLLAALYINQQEHVTGYETLKKGVEMYPEEVQILFEYGLLQEQEGKQQEAITSMEKVLTLQADHAEALNYLGYTWADNNIHLEKALEYVQKAITLKPDNGYIQDSLGWVYFRMGELEKAQKELEHALSLEPKDPNIHDHMGEVYLQNGQKEKARNSWYKAKDLFKEPKMKEEMQKKINATQ